MKKKNRKVSYSKVPARLFVASRVKAGWRDTSSEFEAEWMSVSQIKSYDFSILTQPGKDSLKMEEKS